MTARSASRAAAASAAARAVVARSSAARNAAGSARTAPRAAHDARRRHAQVSDVTSTNTCSDLSQCNARGGGGIAQAGDAGMHAHRDELDTWFQTTATTVANKAATPRGPAANKYIAQRGPEGCTSVT